MNMKPVYFLCYLANGGFWFAVTGNDFELVTSDWKVV